MATLEPFSGGTLNLKRFAARNVTSANLDLEEEKKFLLIYMSAAEEIRRGF